MDTEYEVLAGDPDIVKTKGEEYQAIASAISASVRTLDDIVDQVDQKSLAMDATRDMAEDVASDIRKAVDRYQQTGDALVAYASELRRTKDASRDPVQRISEIETSLATWRWRVSTRQDAYEAAVAAGDADEIDRTRRSLRTAEDQVTELESALGTQRRLWETARDEKQVAATTAVNAITEVTEGKGGEALNDSGWDHFGVVLDWVKVVCDIAAVLSIFLAWVPILGQVLLVLAAIGAIIAIVDAAIKFANGEGSFGELLFAVVVGVISLFGGKLIGMAAQRIRFSMQRAADFANPGMVLRLTGGSAKYSTVLRAYPKKVPQGFLGALKSPFVRSTADLHRMYRFQHGGEGFFSVLKSALKQGNPFNLKNLFKFDGDVADVYHLSTRYADYFDAALHNKANAVVILEGMHSLYDVVRTGSALSDAITGGDALGGLGTGTGHLAGPVPALVGGGARLIKDLETALANGTN